MPSTDMEYDNFSRELYFFVSSFFSPDTWTSSTYYFL